MCGRYAAGADPGVLIEEFEIQAPVEQRLEADYNVAPTKPVYIVVERPHEERLERALVVARWGLIPSWAKDPSIGSRMINARLDTVAEKPAFRSAFAKRRCIVPADGYYEWYTPEAAGGKPVKQPFYIHRSDGAQLAMAGLYDWRRHPDRAPLASPLGALGDTGSALFATIGILAALRHRDATGVGEHVDIAMLDAMVALGDAGVNYLSLGIGGGGETPGINDAFAAADGFFVLQCGRP